MGATAEFTVKLTDQVTKAAKRAGNATGRLLDKFNRLAAQSKQGDKALGRVSGGLDKLREANGRFVAGAGKRGSLFGRGFGQGALDVLSGNLMTSAALKVLDLAKGAAMAGLEFVTFGENSRLALGNLAKHGVAGEKLFEHARATAVRFGLDVKDTTKQYTKFLALQFSPQEAGKMLAMGADLQALGNSAEDVQGVFMALGQIKGKGRLQGEEMLQLAERGISTVLVQEEIGKLLGGKTNKEVQKLQEQGKVDAETGLQAIENAINRKLGQSKLGESGAKFADTTITGIKNRFLARAQDIGLQVFDKLGPSLNKFMEDGFGRIDEFLSSPKGESFIQSLGDGLARVGDLALAALPFIETFVGAFSGGFGEGMTAFGEGIEPILSALGGKDGAGSASNIGMIASGLGQLAAVGVAGLAVLGMVTGGIVALGGAAFTVGKEIVVGLTEPLFKMIGDVVLWWDDLAAKFDAKGMTLGDKAVAIGKHLVMGLVNGIKSIASLPIDAITALGEGVILALKGIFEEGSPSKATRRTGRNAGRGLVIGFQAETRAVRAAGRDMALAGMEAIAFSSDATLGPEASGLAPVTGIDAAAVGGGGPAKIVFTQRITVEGASSPEETARLTAKTSRREVESFFRTLALE